MNEYTYFWQSGSPFSNWYKHSFGVDGVHYNCSEQYMMHKKALLFSDTEVADLILGISDPRLQKAAGREVRNFDRELWMKECEEIMVYGLLRKFAHPPLFEVLMDTGNTIIVEASPYDDIWGIGLTEAVARKTDPTKWPGLNLLGKVLMEVRTILRDLQKP